MAVTVKPRTFTDIYSAFHLLSELSTGSIRSRNKMNQKQNTRGKKEYLGNCPTKAIQDVIKNSNKSVLANEKYIIFQSTHAQISIRHATQPLL